MERRHGNSVGHEQTQPHRTPSPSCDPCPHFLTHTEASLEGFWKEDEGGAEGLAQAELVWR